MIPPEISNSNLNVQAWYMREHLGMTYKQIGEALGYTDSGAHKAVNHVFGNKPARKSVATIYRLQTEYCKTECKDSVGECRDCNLYLFMVKKMAKKVR